MDVYTVTGTVGDEFVAQASELSVEDCVYAERMTPVYREYVAYIHSDVSGLKWPTQIWIRKGQGTQALVYVSEWSSNGKLPTALYREVGK